MKGTADYHSALWPETDAEPVRRAQVGASLALVHDAMQPLPAEFDACDVLYAEPPWRRGFDEFERRADAPADRHFDDLLTALARTIRARRVPMVVVTGKADAKRLPPPTKVYEINLAAHGKGSRSLALAYGLTLHNTASTDSILLELARQFECVGDFTCGYGRTAKAFAQAGKRFVVSDYNPKCIGFIAENGASWCVPT